MKYIKTRWRQKRLSLSGDFAELMDLADKYTKLQVRTNADTPHDAAVARNFGAVGIGLCRTEHMFFDAEKIVAMREMILSPDVEGRRKALAKFVLPKSRLQRYLQGYGRMSGKCSSARSSFA